MLLLSDTRKTHGKHVPLASIRHTDFLEVALKLHCVYQSVLSETWGEKSIHDSSVCRVCAYSSVPRTGRDIQTFLAKESSAVSPHGMEKHGNYLFPSRAEVQNVPLMIS
jgi:hypothetical protein